MPNEKARQLRAADWLMIGVSLGLPTVVTWIYFISLDGAPAYLQQGAYGIGKTIQFALPLVWIVAISRRWPRLTRASAWSLVAGAGFGLIVGAAIIALYLAVLRPLGLFDEAASAVRAKVQSFGAGSPARFLLLAIFYSAIHSLLEEYYWRWFVFGQLARGLTQPAAIVVSSIGFAAHHVLVLGHYFGYVGATSPFTWLFTLAIIIGGAFWAWLYGKSGSLAGAWLSHAVVDAAIFVVGYQMLAA